MKFLAHLRSNRVFFYTLPGAVLWSLPIGVLLHAHFAPILPIKVSTSTLMGFAWTAATFLFPIAMICGFKAIDYAMETKGSHWIASLLMLFNLTSALLSAFGTIGMLMALVSVWTK